MSRLAPALGAFALAALGAVALGAAGRPESHIRSRTESHAPPMRLGSSEPSGFSVEPDARADLRRLWAASSAAKAEQAACLAASVDDDTVRITRVLALESQMRDSLAITAQASLETCGPPEWQGTVHTHVALHEGQRPYSTFSGADRGVMSMWWRRWGMDGVFCVVYSGESLHCEVDGVHGVRIFPSGRY